MNNYIEITDKRSKKKISVLKYNYRPYNPFVFFKKQKDSRGKEVTHAVTMFDSIYDHLCVECSPQKARELTEEALDTRWETIGGGHG